jgi:hypothetical protein
VTAALKLLVELPDLCFRLQPRRDVEEARDDLARFAIVVKDRDRVDLEPANAAVGAKDSFGELAH